MNDIIRLNDLSPEKQLLLQLSNRDLQELLNPVLRQMTAEEHSFQLPESAVKRFRTLQRREKQGFRLDEDDVRWMGYIRAMRQLDTSLPAPAAEDDRALYRRIVQLCRSRHLPEDFAAAIVPSVVSYFQGGEMRPVIFPGPPGCGKTTAARCLADIMQLPLGLISAPRAEVGCGYQGHARAYKGSDVGEFLRLILRSKRLNNLFLIDELDKSAQQMNSHVTQQDELLNILADRELFDNYMELSVSVRHSPVIIAVNDLEALNKPLVDRCTVVEFRAVEPERMALILKDYADELYRGHYQGKLLLDRDVLTRAMEQLYASGVTSVRQHQQLVEKGLERAYQRYLMAEQPGPVRLTESDMTPQVERLSGKSLRRIVGF